MSSRKPLLLAAVLALATLPAVAKDAKVAATVNGKPIYEDQVAQFAAQNGGAPRDAALDELISEQLVYQDAVATGVDKKSEVKDRIEQARRQIMIQAAVQAVATRTPVTDDDAKAEYDQIKGQLAHKEYKARHILVDSKEKAEDAIKELNNGAKFADLATKYSSDSSAKNGGDLGWFAAEQMTPPFAEALRALPKGEYTKTPVQTKFGWHVIMVEDTRDVAAPSFDEIKDRLKVRIQQKRVGQYVEGLHKKAKIEKTKQ